MPKPTSSDHCWWNIERVWPKIRIDLQFQATKHYCNFTSSPLLSVGLMGGLLCLLTFELENRL